MSEFKKALQLNYVSRIDKDYGMEVALFNNEVDVTCWGLLHMTEENLGHTLSREEALSLANEIIDFYGGDRCAICEMEGGLHKMDCPNS
tara:strand:+ start:12514 stop:12780 length:267 start_codon:yes stop_codon:yes gene_type:complete